MQIQSIPKFFLDAGVICHCRSQTFEVFHISGHHFIILGILEFFVTNQYKFWKGHAVEQERPPFLRLIAINSN
jgi:hypothetical protein